MVVLRSGATRREALAQSSARLAQSPAYVVGAVLNNPDEIKFNHLENS